MEETSEDRGLLYKNIREMLALGIKAKACIYQGYLKKASNGELLSPDETRMMDKLSAELTAAVSQGCVKQPHQTCSTCKWFDRYDAQPEYPIGFCHKRSPISLRATPKKPSTRWSYWPGTNGDDFCKDWESSV